MKKSLMLIAITLFVLGTISGLQAQPPSPAPATGAAVAETAPQPQAGGLKSKINEVFSIPMWPLWICSLVLITLIFERFRALQARRILDAEMVDQVIGKLAVRDLDGAREAANSSDTLVGRAWSQGLHQFQLGGDGLQECLTNASLIEMKPLKRRMQAIGTIASISPLLGLLGTIIGMIMTFDQIVVSQGADKAKLAAGIMVALFTTAFGIIIAVPGIVCGRYFNARINAFAEEVEADINRACYNYSRSSQQQED